MPSTLTDFEIVHTRRGDRSHIAVTANSKTLCGLIHCDDSPRAMTPHWEPGSFGYDSGDAEFCGNCLPLWRHRHIYGGLDS